MHARESLLQSDLFGEDLDKLFPIIEPENRTLHPLTTH